MAKKKNTPFFGHIKHFVAMLFLGANLFTLLLLWICCATTWVYLPAYPRMGTVGLAFPIFLVLNLLFIPLWLIYKPRMLVVPIVGMALCGGYILDYFPLNFGHPQDEPELTVMTWNTSNMTLYGADSLHFATDYVVNSGADVIFLQEHLPETAKFHAMNDTLRARGYHIDYRKGRTIITRFPILSIDTLKASTSLSNGILRADLQYQDDTLTVFCVHLESNKLSFDDKSEYGEAIKSPEQKRIKHEVGYLGHKIGAASTYRAQQTKALLNTLDSLPDGRSVLVCGDFNDTPISYAYQKINHRLDNAFRHKGHGVGVTYNERFFPIRIDHIFYSSDWQCTEVHIEQSMMASDHYPVVARLKKRQK